MQGSVTRKGGEPLRNFTIALSKDQAEVQAEQLAVLRHPTRQRIIKLLEKYNDRRLCVFEIAEVLEINYGAISYPWQNCVTVDWSVQRDIKCISTTNWILRRSQHTGSLREPYEPYPFPCSC